MKKISQIVLAFLLMGVGFSSQAVSAPAPKSVGKFQAWSAYILEEKGSKTCWVASKPMNSKAMRPEGKVASKKTGAFKRQDVFFMVSHRPQDNVKDEVSYFLGAPAGSSPIEVTIAKTKKFDMLAKQEWAWFSKKSDEKEWLKSASSVKGFTLKTAYEKGPTYYDDYSFQGFKEASEALENACSGKAVTKEKTVKKEMITKTQKASAKTDTHHTVPKTQEKKTTLSHEKKASDSAKE